LGLIWEVYEDDAFDQSVIELAERLAEQPSSSISLIKKGLKYCFAKYFG
jgi:2-(1,2-epoxy-1,2-dihydrophenyl)acetyl-CoA isomerase